MRHSAKNTRQKIDRQNTLCRVSFIGHSAKALPSAPGTLGKEKRPSRRRSRWRSLYRVPTLQALGKDFFIFFKKIYLPSANPEGTRQRAFIFFEKILCRVPTLQALGKVFLFFLKEFLCRVPAIGHSAKIFFLNFFAECHMDGTRQRFEICFLKNFFAECQP